jgi:hypothetical protein
MRTKTITALAYKMRYAENYYLDSGTDYKKDKVIKELRKLKPSEKEYDLFNSICDSMGI